MKKAKQKLMENLRRQTDRNVNEEKITGDIKIRK